MGTDIRGWIEVFEVFDQPRDLSGAWRAAVRIDNIVERNYGMFGSLFGVRNDYGFRPIAAERGVPFGISSDLVRYYEMPADPADRGPDWALSPTWISQRELQSVDWQELGEQPEPGTPPGPLRRREEVVTPGWRTVLDIMEVLARQFGDDGVRLVVWFY
jgi:hypothetical protein